MRHKFFRTKKIGVFRDGKRIKLEKSLTLQKDDEIKLFFHLSEFGEKKDTTKNINFDAILNNPKLKQSKVQYEDEYMWIVEKPAGVAVHPGTGVRFGHSLIDYYVAVQKKSNPTAPDPKLVHRLDKDTSGLVIIAKNDAFLRKIITTLQEKDIEKQYYALVMGEVEKQKGTIREAIQRTKTSKANKISLDMGGKESVTHYLVKEYFPHLDATLLDITLETGRMHQIRVHFQGQGHPLAGDKTYGDFKWNKILQKEKSLKRHFLHAYSLSFYHPETGKKVWVTSSLPEELISVIRA